MLVVRIILMCITVTVLPIMAGYDLAPVEKEKKTEKIVLGWLLGLQIMWAAFLAVCVPMILAGETFGSVVEVYAFLCLGLFGLSGGIIAVRLFTTKDSASHIQKPKRKADAWEMFFWSIAVILFIMQIFCVFFLAYEEGDDAYYVAVTTMCSDGDRLYNKIPYTGAYTDLTGRYALAPFPVWVAFLARISGFSGAVTAHLVMPVLVLGMAYACYFLIGKKMLSYKKQTEKYMPVYLCLVELLVMFGGYSTYSKDNFLLVRAGQGKAVLANVVMPLLFYMLYLMVERLEEKKNVGFRVWCLTVIIIIAGCLCSTLGGILLCELLFVGLLIGAICYKKWMILLYAIPSSVIPMIIVLLYLKM